MAHAAVPQSTTILVPPEELRAKLDNITEALLANMARLAIALSLMTEEQIARYNEMTANSAPLVEREEEHVPSVRNAE